MANVILSPDCMVTRYTITFMHNTAIKGRVVYTMMSPGLLFVFILNLHSTKFRLGQTVANESVLH